MDQRGAPDGLQQIFIGDVQGCCRELEEILARAVGAFGDGFHLHVVGDLINRGPDNLAVLERVRTLVDAGRATYVLGNHEIGLLMVAWELAELSESDTLGEVLDSSEADDWIEWLRRRPLVETGALAGQAYAMVHAAAHPQWDLVQLKLRADRSSVRLADPDPARARDFLAADLESDPDRDLLARLTRCRSIHAGGWSSRAPEVPADAWHARWLAARHDYGVVYGHWAVQGLHVAKGIRGLDTGCVHHGREAGRDGYLTAWLPGLPMHPEAKRCFDVPDDRFWQVRAKRRYWRD